MRGVAGVVLAGGRSRRMGTDKAVMTLDGQTLLARALDRLSPQVDEVVLSLGDASPSSDELDLAVVRDSVAGQAGPLAGILSAMEWAAARGLVDLVSVAVDTPFFPHDLVARLMAGRAPGQEVVVAASGDRRHPTFMLVPVDLRADLAAFVAGGGARVSEWLDRHGARSVEFPMRGDLDPFFNVNTPEDLAEARALSACTTR